MKGRREEIWRCRRGSEGEKIGNKVYKRVYIRYGKLERSS